MKHCKHSLISFKNDESLRNIALELFIPIGSLCKVIPFVFCAITLIKFWISRPLWSTCKTIAKLKRSIYLYQAFMVLNVLMPGTASLLTRRNCQNTGNTYNFVVSGGNANWN